MPTTQRDKYPPSSLLSAVRESQVAVLDVLRVWSDIGQQLTQRLALPVAAVDLTGAVDRAFDVAEQTLRAQHQLARTLVGVATRQVDIAVDTVVETIDTAVEAADTTVKTVEGTEHGERWYPGILSGEAVLALALDEGPRHAPEQTALEATRQGNDHVGIVATQFLPVHPGGMTPGAAETVDAPGHAHAGPLADFAPDLG